MKNSVTPTISQILLGNLVTARKAATTATKCRDALRDKITGLLAAGATVEPGAFDCTLETKTYLTFSRVKLVAVLGEKAVAALAQRIEPTEQVHLVISDEPCFEPPPPRLAIPRAVPPIDDSEDTDF